MSLYRRIQTPNSPLLPLSPIMVSPSNFLSPFATSIRSRRSFTPNQLNFLPPPSVSPICGHLSSCEENQSAKCKSATPNRQLDSSLILPPSKTSIKKIRSSARKLEARTNHAFVPLSPIRRTLFCTPNPVAIKITTPKSSGNLAQFVTPRPKYRTIATPKHQSNAQTPKQRYELLNHMSSPYGYNENYDDDYSTPNMHSILEETFTVMSILKEIRMEKYASVFAREEVDLFVFLVLNNEDMIELGIDEIDRPILLNAIHCFTEIFGTPGY